MALYSPDSNLSLLAVPLQSDYSHTLWFDSKDSQTSYFKGKIAKTIEEGRFQYIKYNNTIVIPGNVDTLYICNYIMYQNQYFGDKWFYAFITKMEWASQNSTRLYVAVDCIQTWYFDINWYDCYIIRAHQNTDEPGDNIIPEDFQMGDGGYDVVGYKTYAPNGISYFATCSSSGSAYGGEFVNGMYTGAKESTSIGDLSSYVQNGMATGVCRVQQYPSELSGGSVTYNYPKYPNVLGSGYTPKNKKMLTGACLSAFLSAYGQEISFNQDFCSGDDIQLKFVCDKTSGMVTCFVTNYSLPDGSSDSKMSTLSLSFQIPESNWAYSQYKNDYNLHAGSNSKKIERMKTERTLNAVESGAQIVGGVAQAGASYVSGYSNPAALGKTVEGMAQGASQVYQGAKKLAYIGTGIDEISQDLAYINESLNAPPTGGLTQAGTYIVGDMTNFCYGYKIPPISVLERYDQYLTVYGYKQSTFMKPNLHARSCWTYIQTGMVNADGKFPQDDLMIIKAAFNRGIFFWDNTVTFGDFSQDNSPAG